MLTCVDSITCPLSVATTRILLDAGGGAKNDEKIKIDVDPALLVKELETQVISVCVLTDADVC
jgi:hypothetical protein